jgi:hypothetical protein
MGERGEALFALIVVLKNFLSLVRLCRDVILRSLGKLRINSAEGSAFRKGEKMRDSPLPLRMTFVHVR